MTSLTSFWYLYRYFCADYTQYTGVSTVDFEEVNTSETSSCEILVLTFIYNHRNENGV